MTFGSRVAAMHSALWSIDGGYRLWWRVWPASMGLLICGWIYLEKPAATISSPARREASAPAAPEPARSAGVARPSEKEPVIPWPEKLRGDPGACNNDALSPGLIIAACSRLIESGLLTERQLAAAYYRRGFHSATTQPDRALADYDVSLKLVPDSPAVLTDRGWLHLEHDRAAAGLADLNKAIGIWEYPRSARARLFRASAFLMLNDSDKAIADLDESQKIDPTSAVLYLTRGDIEFAKKRYDAALQAYDEFSKRSPNAGEGLIGRGLVLEATGHPAEALGAIESGLKLGATNAEAITARARLRAGDATRCFHDLGFDPSGDACSRLVRAARERLGR